MTIDDVIFRINTRDFSQFDRDVKFVFEYYKNDLFFIAINSLEDRGIAKDFVQNTYIKFINSWEKGSLSFHTEKELKAYLRTILKNLIIDEFRRNTIDTTFIDLISIEDDNPSPPDLLIMEEDNLSKKLSIAILNYAINQLEEDEKEIIDLEFKKKINITRIAIMLGYTRYMIVELRKSALQKLKKIIEDFLSGSF